MGLFSRFFAELRNPALKCERAGHRWMEHVWIGWVHPEYEADVGDKILRSRTECWRCHQPQSDWKIESRESYQSISWPDEDWAEYDKTGELMVDENWNQVPV